MQRLSQRVIVRLAWTLLGNPMSTSKQDIVFTLIPVVGDFTITETHKLTLAESAVGDLLPHGLGAAANVKSFNQRRSFNQAKRPGTRTGSSHGHGQRDRVGREAPRKKKLDFASRIISKAVESQYLTCACGVWRVPPSPLPHLLCRWKTTCMASGPP